MNTDSQSHHPHWIFYLAIFATICTLAVTTLGAYTRLKDAGLGCPDWPLCYGQLKAPATLENIEKASIAYPNQTIDPSKAKIEMLHRYAASFLGFLIVFMIFYSFSHKKSDHSLQWLSIILFIVILSQGLLGRFTVTLKLYPAIVMMHLLGGLTTLCLFWLIALNLNPFVTQKRDFVIFSNPLAIGALITLLIQLFLGGWTSANYAALVCPDFPYCRSEWEWLPNINWNAFHVWEVGLTNSPGTPLDLAGRITIHMIHRLGALITSILILLLTIQLWRKGTPAFMLKSAVLGILLMIQICLGITLILKVAPLSIAILHHFFGALLLLTLLTVCYLEKPRAKFI